MQTGRSFLEHHSCQTRLASIHLHIMHVSLTTCQYKACVMSSIDRAMPQWQRRHLLLIPIVSVLAVHLHVASSRTYYEHRDPGNACVSPIPL